MWESWAVLFPLDRPCFQRGGIAHEHTYTLRHLDAQTQTQVHPEHLDPCETDVIKDIKWSHSCFYQPNVHNISSKQQFFLQTQRCPLHPTNHSRLCTNLHVIKPHSMFLRVGDLKLCWWPHHCVSTYTSFTAEVNEMLISVALGVIRNQTSDYLREVRLTVEKKRTEIWPLNCPRLPLRVNCRYSLPSTRIISRSAM